MSKVNFSFDKHTQSHIWSYLNSLNYKIFSLSTISTPTPFDDFKEIILFKDFEVGNGVLGLNRDCYLSIVRFKEIIVLKDFEVGNSILGLNRDVYLSLVRFLDSSILRKV
jgi:hypothetical protein